MAPSTAAAASVSADTISILSLNCWGLKYISKHRTARLKYIASRIATSTYEIVGLQECWAYADYLEIRSQTQHILPYGKYYFSGSIGGGLVILSKWPIEQSSMFRYPLNGRPTAFFRGDYYVGKGVASALIRRDNHFIEVFCTHLHAPYEKNDSYLCHRTAQAWEISKLLRGAVQKGHITIALGDFNMIPDSLAHRLIRSVGHVSDSWLSLYPSTLLLSPPETTPQQNIDVYGTTCDSQLNSWRLNDTMLSKAHPDAHAKRLDYVFHSPTNTTVTDAKVCFTERMPILDVSASDHFGISVALAITPQPHITFPSVPVILYDDILAMTARYMSREYRQRRLRISHFFVMIVCVTGLLIGQFWVRIKGVTFLMMLVSWLWGVGATCDGLIGFVFMGSEIRALKEFAEEMRMQKDKVLRAGQEGRGVLSDVPREGLLR